MIDKKVLLQKGSVQLIKKINSNIIIDCIKQYKNGISRTQISRELHISKPTVSKIVNELIQKNIIINLGKGITDIGRKPNLIAFNKDYGFIISLDLGLCLHKIAVSNLNGEIIEKRRFRTLDLKKEERLEKIISEIIIIRDKFYQKKDTLVLISIGIPGIVDIEKGTVSYAPNIFPTWDNYPLRKKLEEALGTTKILIENDVNLSAFGEFVYYYKKKPANLLFITWSSGVGGGIILNKSIYRGTTGAAGELGYSIIRKKGFEYKITDIGYPGYLESIASTGIMISKAQKYANDKKDSKLYSSVNGKIEDISLELIFKLARENDEFCSTMLNEALQGLIAGIVNGIVFLDPKIVIIGGDVSDVIFNNEFYINEITSCIKNYVPFVPLIHFSHLGSDAGIMGGIAYCLELLNDIII